MNQEAILALEARLPGEPAQPRPSPEQTRRWLEQQGVDAAGARSTRGRRGPCFCRAEQPALAAPTRSEILHRPGITGELR
jgi:hypothetical protein